MVKLVLKNLTPFLRNYLETNASIIDKALY